MQLIQLLLLVALAIQVTGFTPASRIISASSSTSARRRNHRNHRNHGEALLFMAGFGGGAKSEKGKKKDAPIKLKPKLQWDRYAALKKFSSVEVGIRLVNDEEAIDGNAAAAAAGAANSEWLSVGKVKSKDDESTAAAVAMQRGIIAEHGRRLHPLRISKKSAVEWGYRGAGDSEDPESGGWTVVDIKSTLVDVADGFEKEIGFEGIGDPATGFYCVYDNGKLKVGDETSFVLRPYDIHDQ